VSVITSAVPAGTAGESGKLGMRDRVDLTRYAIRRGLIEP
jgi:hypothetical protein